MGKHKCFINIYKKHAILIIVACLIAFLSPHVAIDTMADSFAISYDICNHSCEAEYETGRYNQTENIPACTSKCHTGLCNSLIGIKEAAFINIPCNSTETVISFYEQFVKKDIIGLIFKPPKI